MKYLGRYLILMALLLCPPVYASGGGNIHENPASPPSTNNDNTGNSKKSSALPTPTHAYRAFKISGAEAAGVTGENIIQINLLTDDLTKMAVTTFMQIIMERRFDGGYAERAMGSLFSHVPSRHNNDKTALSPALYAMFSHKKSDGSQFMIISSSIKRMETAKDYAIPTVFKITDTQWTGDPNGSILTLFLQPVSSSKPAQ